MDKTVPPGAALLLGLIYRTETGHDAPECYEVIFGHNQGKLPKPITSMTLDEIEKAQPQWTKKFGSSAMGAGQFMKNTLDAPGTLRDIEGEMGLTGREKATPDLQDRMAYHLLKRRGFLDFIAGKMSRTAFGNRLSMEWASFPVLADIKGRRRKVKRGQSYYAGDGLNKSLVSPEEVEATLDQVLAMGNLPAAAEADDAFRDMMADEANKIEPVPPAPAKAGRPGWIGIALIVGLAVLAFVGSWFGNSAETVSLIGDDRLGLFGGEGNVWTDIGMSIALSFLRPLVDAAVVAVVGIVALHWQKWFKVDFDAKSRQTLQEALERGALAALEAFGPRASKAKLTAATADYVQRFSGGTVKGFGLSAEDLQQLALPHLAIAKKTVAK